MIYRERQHTSKLLSLSITFSFEFPIFFLERPESDFRVQGIDDVGRKTVAEIVRISLFSPFCLVSVRFCVFIQQSPFVITSLGSSTILCVRLVKA